MNPCKLLAAALGVAAVAGCASTDRQTVSSNGGAAADEEKTYVTGSRIPVRDRSPNHDVKAVTNRQDIERIVRPGGNATGGITGAGGN